MTIRKIYQNVHLNPAMIIKATFVILVAMGMLAPELAIAAPPSLKVTPLKYEESLTLGKVKRGYIDVANPSDTTVSIASQLQAFRQTGNEGSIEFYDDARLAQGIKVDLAQFQLGPREAVRVAFTIDPNQLNPGGIYAAIFFRTLPPAATSGQSQISQSVRVGTLLILDNGGQGLKQGKITKVTTPLLAFGKNLTVRYTFANTGSGNQAIAFNPSFTTKVGFLGHKAASPSGLVMPGSERIYSQSVTGNHLGIIPVTVHDAITGSTKTAYSIGIIGPGAFALATVLVCIIVFLVIWILRRR